MNDRYLVRAKRIDNGEWVEGFLFQLCYDSIFCWCIGNEPLSPNDYSELCGFNREWFYIDESTICQCTGLKDKNGKLIWENDIVAYYFGKTCAPICFGSYQSCFDNTKTEHVGFYVNWNDKCNYRKDLGYWINMIEADVVGNIFDNPELLEVEE